jgi:hypothetical protein
MIDIAAIRQRFLALGPHLTERARRIFAATEAQAVGYGGIAAVSRATGIAASTIGRGLAELSIGEPLAPERIRRPGGGGKRLVDKDPMRLADLMALVEPDERGDPMSPLRWSCKSLSHLADALNAMGHKIGRSAVGALLRAQNFSLQANRKTREGASHPDRDAQFAHRNASVRRALADGAPVISVDTKKKELVGAFKNAGRTWRPKGEPEAVRVHDFLIEELGRATPYGIYDLADNAGWVSVGMSNDTAAFAIQSIRRWWREGGQKRYPFATRLTITADGGGSNASRSRPWKLELQCLADEVGLDIVVHHLPPGTSKWNKIEHRLFSFISMNCKATPLVSYRVIVDLIAATTTKTGLTVRCELDSAHYPKGVGVSQAQMDSINISRDAFHGDWNYTISPKRNEGCAS